MYYEINVSLVGRHFFATAKRSITTEEKFLKVYAVIRKKFPESEGFSLSVTHFPGTGNIFDLEALNQNIDANAKS